MVTLQFTTSWNEKQKLWFKYLLDNKTNRIWYGGAAWGWKSYTGVAWQWMRRNKYAGTRWFFGRKELKNLKRTTLATYFKFLDDYNIPEAQRGSYNAQDSIIRFSNGSEIHLLDLAHQPSDPLYTRFGSSEYTDWFIDESNEVAEDCKNLLYTRIGRHKNKELWLVPKMLETFNPDKWHVYRDYYIPSKKEGVEWTREFDWPFWPFQVNWCFITALATDNKLLPEDYINNLASSSEVTKQRLLLGNFEYDDTPWRIFDFDAINNLWNNWRNTGEYFVTCDAARKWKDKAVIYLWNWWLLEKVIEFATCTTVEIEDEIKKLQVLHSFPMSRVVVDDDWVGWWPVDHLWCKWFVNNCTPISPANSTKVAYKKRNYKNLKTQCYFMLADKVNEWGISIVPEYIKESLIQELDVVIEINEDKDGKKEICDKAYIKGKIGRSPDYADALMMRMFFELRKQWPEGEVIQWNDWIITQIEIDDRWMLPEDLEEDLLEHQEVELSPY